MTNCPYCQGENIKRDGITIKGFQRFFCHFCKKYWQGNYVRKKSTLLDDQKKIISWARSHPVLSQHLIAVASDNIFLLACPNGKYHGLWLHLKSKENTEIYKENSKEIKLEKMSSMGYHCETIHEFQEALQKIENYLAICTQQK